LNRVEADTVTFFRFGVSDDVWETCLKSNFSFETSNNKISFSSQCKLPTTFATSPSISLFLVSEVTFIHHHFHFFNFNFWFQIFHLSEWLVDRKRVPADWRKRVAAIKARISNEFSSLPKDSDPLFQTLDPEG
jgi:hypothetical protein